ncbi:Putative sodium-coupled neutral amino acid transporter 11 [Seminavis robusta]|uniref:Sodium-coupled neutral amino acid transporter 11 n=1 Tax=Seminavis robusta TaxID=568900 RepID=A0A9N8EPN8_9STRA|nr:Putative sodium-coupled neutral amino acid transporter 11 [Seminavis robusta]|eukprot:Sro1611_g285900.1 Putative sodium-coupled neutral amino acid transporter 11 (713) ;mRNA; f:5119-7334
MPTSSASSVPPSPFFKPRLANTTATVQTPGGTVHQQPDQDKEHRSTRLGCACNLINAIVGSGIVGIPYALQQSGFIAGIGLIVLCAILCDKSLRLLLATAKHAKVPSYETLAEAAFGKGGFLFITINMFIMAYGAMLSYLMIVKDTFSVALGIPQDDLPRKRAVLFVISFLIIVPLSAQRDMADLAKTSRISVFIDILLVLVVAYKSPLDLDRANVLWHDQDFIEHNLWIHTETIFVGLGVLSFAFVCQHSAFIIAGSLERPTLARWSNVTNAALVVCAALALTCGTAGYLGFLQATQGNIINNLPMTGDILSNTARGMLGTTMLLVYPMESFVARHVLVVLLFEGRRAHEGDDSSILARRDRRVALTMALYISALVPALLFENFGHVLAATGAVGGSCLSYIGPGAIYLGIHGDEFLDLIRKGTWWNRWMMTSHDDNTAATTSNPATATVDLETTALLHGKDQGKTSAPTVDPGSGPNNLHDGSNQASWLAQALQAISWYLGLMPLWCAIAQFGEETLTQHRQDLVLKSPHPLRIGDVVPDTPQATPRSSTRGDDDDDDHRFIRLSLQGVENTARANSFHSGERAAPGGKPTALLVESSGSLMAPSYQTNSSTTAKKPATPTHKKTLTTAPSSSSPGTPSLNQQIGAKLVSMQKQKQNQRHKVKSRGYLSLEKDPQKSPSTVMDFLIAIFFVLFGVVAMVVGLVSMYIADG